MDSSLNPYWNNNAHWYTSSDATLKEDIQTIPNALAIVKSLRGTTFKWKDKTKRDNKTHIGLIAQEVEEVIPNWVKTGADGIKGIVVENDTALFIEAIKEQDAKITALETTVATQQKLIDDLVARIEKLGKK